MNADAVGGGLHEVLTVAEYRDDRYLQAGQKMHEHLITSRVLPYTIRNYCQLTIAPVNLRDQQKFGNKTRCTENIDLRWQNRDQDTTSIVDYSCNSLGSRAAGKSIIRCLVSGLVRKYKASLPCIVCWNAAIP